jgi:hypothetical protein
VAQPTIEATMSAPTSEPAIYRERQWIPLWVVLAMFAGMVAFVLAIAVIADLVDPGRSSTSVAGVAAIAVGGGVFFVAIALYSTLFVVITVQDGTLKVRRHGTVQLTSNVEARVVRGDEAKKLRNNMNLALSPGGTLTPFGQLGGAIGGASVGISAIAAARRSRGLVMAIWMREGVLVHAPDNRRTKLWLIGSRHADELAAAIQARVADASSG